MRFRPDGCAVAASSRLENLADAWPQIRCGLALRGNARLTGRPGEDARRAAAEAFRGASSPGQYWPMNTIDPCRSAEPDTPADDCRQISCPLTRPRIRQ